MRDSRRVALVENLVRDLRLALRQLRKQRALSAAAIISLALGIGANAAVFQLFSALVLRSLPVAEANQLVEIRLNGEGRAGRHTGRNRQVSLPQFEELARQQGAFESMLAVGDTRFNLASQGEVRYAEGLWVDRPESGIPPRVGSAAPSLPATLQPEGDGPLPDVRGRAHLLFFWATWCGPCKAAVPEVMAFAAAKGLPVLAITDEEPAAVTGFRGSWKESFFDNIAIDNRRRTFISHAVSGTPTIVLVDETGVVRHRQVGYSIRTGLTINGWRWSPR